VRNLGLKLALWLTALLPINSFALGLGEIEVNSFLNQPLNAEIEVISARAGEIDDLLVSLATREAFVRAGLERPRHLSDLMFAVEKSEDGETAVIMVTTRSAVKEPFLNFLIEADWSKGRLLREFTVLLDPPFYAEQPAPMESLSESSPPEPAQKTAASESSLPADESAGMSSGDATAGGTITEPIALSGGGGTVTEPPETQASSPPSGSEYVNDESENIIQGDVLVVKGDTLWGIASRYKDKDHSMAQVMLAFQRANPNAFGNGNINNMKVGAVLRAPGADELDALDKQAAYAETLVQNGLWDEYVARVTGVSPATGSSAGGSQSSAEGASESQSELSLLVPGEGDSSSTGTGDSADIEQLRTKLALAEEELEASRIENTDLESRISELQARLSKVEELQKMVEIEDDSLAQLQAQQNDSQAAAPIDGSSEESMAGDAAVDSIINENAVAETIKADEEALLEELLAEEAAAQVDEETAMQPDSMAADEGTESADGMTEEPMTVAGAGDDQMVDDEVKPAAAIPLPAPVIITEPAGSGGSMLDGVLPAGLADMIPSMGALFGNPIILAALGGVILLLLVLVVLKRRKAAQNDDDSALGETGDDDLFAGDDEEELTPIHLAEFEEPAETDIEIPSAEDAAPEETLAADEVDEFAATAIIAASDMPEAEAPKASTAEQDDVLNEVDVYLAYGLYDNAEDLLKSSLVENPDRADYRAKLLDTYFATKNSGSFITEAENLKGMGDLANSYWDRVQIMGYELAPDNALFSDAKDSGLSAADLEIAKPQEADFDLSASEEDDTNFSSTDFNLAEGDEGDFGGDAPLDSGGDGALDEAGSLESTQQISAVTDGQPSFDVSDSDEADELLELPDDIGGELEFSMDDEALDEDDDLAGGLAAEIQLPDEDMAGDLDLDSDDDSDPLAGLETNEDDSEDDLLSDFDLDDFAETEDKSPTDAAAGLADDDDDDIALDFDMEDDDGLDLDDAVQISAGDEDELDMAKTEIITPNYDDTAIIQQVDSDQDSAEDDGIDLGMEDTAMKDIEKHIEETGELVLDVEDADEDISIIDFGGDDFLEPTEMMPTVGSVKSDVDEDDFVLDDEGDEEVRTGTFAPGDFDEPTAAIDSLANIDDLDDLMLPDDVDEVSTKLDLARAFIDMGDTEGARGSLEEVMSEGNAEQKAEAKALLDQM
jgi:pilus assembly protein FimV